MWWPNMDRSIEDLAKSCPDCQAVGKAPPVAPLQPWEWPSRVFQCLHIDFAGPFQGSMFLVVVDAYSKWPFVSVMQSTTVEKQSKNFVSCLQCLAFPNRSFLTTDRNSRQKHLRYS